MFCLKCGTRLNGETGICAVCGAVLEEDAKTVKASSGDLRNDMTDNASEPISKMNFVKAPIGVSDRDSKASEDTLPIPAQRRSAAVAAARHRPRNNAPRKRDNAAPLPVWKFICIFLIQMIPVVGQLMILIWSFAGSCNQNTRNYARAVIITFVIFATIAAIGYFTLWDKIVEIFQLLENLL